MCPPPASGKGGRPMTRTHEISGSGQIFALLVLSQCFWLLCCRPSLVNGLLSMAASAVAYGVVFLLAVFCRRCAARGETPLSPVFAAWGALLAVGYFAVTAEQLLSAARVLFEGVFSPLLLLLVLLGAVWAAAAAGQEALGRAAFVSLFLFLIAVLLLTLGVLPQATALNLRLPEEDLSRLGEEILFILPRQAEPLLLLLFAQRCSRPRSAALLLWVPAGWLLGGLLLLLAFIGGLFIEKSNGQPVVSAVGLVLGDAACYVLGTAWFVFQMQCELGYALAVCVYPFIVLDLAKIVVSCIVGALLRKRLVQAGVLHLKEA